MNRLVRQEVRSSTGREILAYDYRYDAATNLVERRRTSREALTFGYTPREELATVRRRGQRIAHYEYDPAGNRSLALSGRSSYGAGSVLLTSPHGRYEHDEVGRPTRLDGPSGVTAYSYDDLGRLVRVGLPDGGCVEFSYDALFRRRTKTALTGTRRTVWAGDVPLEESLAHGGSIKYLYDPVSEAPLAVEIGGEWHCVVRDGHGDITDLIRARDETVVWSAEPLGFETRIVLDDLPEPFPLRGVGQMFDSETGLVYQRARYYAPHEGRFLTPDPIGPAGGPNPYSYCLNQPLLWVDPLGLNPCLSRDECDRIRDRIQRHSAEVSARWNEMRYPKQILPFSGPTRAQGRRAAGKAVAPGAHGAPNFGTKGTVESHLPPYDDAQRALNEAFQEYDRGQCHKHETKGDRKKVKRAREFRNKRPELHPDYGKKGPLPSSIQGRVSIAKG